MLSPTGDPVPQRSNFQDSITSTQARAQEAGNNKKTLLEVPGRRTSNVEGNALVIPDEDISHDGGYGWVCVACMFFISANTWGVNGVRTTSSFAWNLLRLT